MRRRDFITLLGGAAAWPLAARAQQSGRMRHVGVLEGVAEDNVQAQPRRAAFQQGLERLGWVEGRNVRFDYRYGAGVVDRYQAFAKELLVLQPDVVLATTTPAVAALKSEGGAIPIVFTFVSDPIGSGFITSLARPGGNITGFLNLEATIASKWLAMLKEIAPQLRRAAFMANPKTTPFDYWLPEAEAAARSLAIELLPSRVESAADIERAIESVASAPNGGLVLPPDTFFSPGSAHFDLIVALTTRYRLPTVSSNGLFVMAGGLMSYGIDTINVMRQAAVYVDRILRGEKPADLPVQAPVKFETLLNLKTARGIGLTVPESMLLRADEVIE
jgi:putative ABC transport system substrate-binding protein